VLSDVASEQGPGTLRQRGRKVVPVQERYGALFAAMLQILLGAGAVAVQVVSRAENCNGAVCLLHATA